MTPRCRGRWYQTVLPAAGQCTEPDLPPQRLVELGAIGLEAGDLVVTDLRCESTHRRARVSTPLVSRQRRDGIDVRRLQDGLTVRLDPSCRHQRMADELGPVIRQEVPPAGRDLGAEFPEVFVVVRSNADVDRGGPLSGGQRPEVSVVMTMVSPGSGMGADYFARWRAISEHAIAAAALTLSDSM